VGFHFNLTFGLRPQVDGIKIVRHCLQKIQVEWLIATLISLFCVAIVISEPFFCGAYFRPDFAAIRREKFAALYFWFEAKLKQKKFILK